MVVTVNGEQLTVGGTTMLELLQQLEVDPRRVAVELNLDILPKGEYATTPLNEGDRIEIVHFVGGG
jgi:sulfur carrier protein